MGGGVFEAGQQGVIGRLLLFRQGDGLVFQRDRRIQVDGFVHLAAFDDALGAEVVQHGFGDAVGLHLVLGTLSPAQQGHCRLDGLVVGAEGALLEEMHQPQQLRRQAGRGRGHVEEVLELCVFRLFVAGQHHAHPGLAPPPERHQHHAAEADGLLLVGHDGVGIEFVEVEGRVAHGNAYRFWHSRLLVICRGRPAGG